MLEEFVFAVMASVKFRIDMKSFACLVFIAATAWAISDTFNSHVLAQSKTTIHPRTVLTIGVGDDNWVLNARGIAGLDDGTLLVSDKLGYCIKTFDAQGRNTGKYGKRGNDAGEFRGPGPIDAFHNIVAVADFASPRVQLFSKEFAHRLTFFAPGPIFDVAFDPDGMLWVGAVTGRKGQTLFQYDTSGRLRKTIPLRYSEGDEFDDIFSLTISASRDIIVTYIVLNKIEIWNVYGQFKTETELPGIIGRPPKKTVSRGLFNKGLEVPEGNISWGAAVDPRGNIYVLSAEYSEHPNQDVFVFDPTGKYLTQFCLPSPASYIWIDPRGSLFTVENHRTILKQYRLE